MTSELLRALVTLEAAMIAWLLAVQAAHAWADRRRRHDRPALDAARRTVLRAVVAGDAAAGAAALGNLDPATRDDLLCAVAASIESRRDPLFATIAADVGTIARLERAVGSRRWWVRRSALRRLTVLGCTTPDAMNLHEDRDARVRAAAAEWMAHTAVDGAAERLLVMTGDRDERVRASATVALCSLGSDAVPVLHSALRASDRERVRAAITVVGAMGDAILSDAVRPLLDHADREVAMAALRVVPPALGNDDVELLEGLMGHDDPGIRRGAVEAAGRARLVAMIAPVAGRLDDPDGAVREAAIAALDCLGNGGRLLLDRAARAGGGHG